jgi:hypothetical protein
MKTEFIPYNEALELKELGFDEPCFGRYYYKDSYPMLNPNSGETELVFEFCQYIKQTEITILAPLYQQAFRWFREKYDLREQYGVFPHHTIMFNYMFNGGIEEEAELECLKKLIEIVKEKK